MISSLRREAFSIVLTDVDECIEELHGCHPEEETCRNTAGAYECDVACEEGFQFSLVLRTCVGESVILSASTVFYILNYRYQEISTILTNINILYFPLDLLTSFHILKNMKIHSLKYIFD